jgi:hypothetical protein
MCINQDFYSWIIKLFYTQNDLLFWYDKIFNKLQYPVILFTDITVYTY